MLVVAAYTLSVLLGSLIVWRLTILVVLLALRDHVKHVHRVPCVVLHVHVKSFAELELSTQYPGPRAETGHRGCAMPRRRSLPLQDGRPRERDKIIACRSIRCNLSRSLRITVGN